MLTKEQIQEVEQYHSLHQVTIRESLRLLGYSEWTYYKTKKRLSEDETYPQGFIPLKSAAGSAANAQRRPGIAMTVEIRTVKGSEIRLIGEVDSGMIKDILSYV